ncbi:tRNA (guanosine(37)-N1)-methyltransferase TrmD [Sinorhizobium meliloti]|nr:tRNA (guanosine(37)-N1)-methyltransferase TrmD [Sinorhizobium meliloti]
MEAVQIRDFAGDKHRTVDDTPAGGGAGMVLKPDVLARAIDHVAADDGRPRLLMSPRGRPADTGTVAGAGRLSRRCHRLRTFRGRRPAVIDTRGLEEVSIGDYILSGGEPAALVLLERRGAYPAGRDGQSAVRRPRELRGRAPRTPPLHASPDLRRSRNPGRPHLRQPAAIAQWRKRRRAG